MTTLKDLDPLTPQPLQSYSTSLSAWSRVQVPGFVQCSLALDCGQQQSKAPSAMVPCGSLRSRTLPDTWRAFGNSRVVKLGFKHRSWFQSVYAS